MKTKVQCKNCRNPILRKCEDETHTPEMGTWESFGTLENLEFDCKGQNTSHWGVFYIVGKLSKCRCRKWPRMSHLDICSTSYGKKKGRKSNWQFDSRPLKVRNRPDPGVCRWSVTHHWKALKESYKFSVDLVPIGVWAKSYSLAKLQESKPWQFRDSSLGVPGQKTIQMWVSQGGTENILYRGRWWFPPSPGRLESCESIIARGLS
jgi:hypothetical protein